VSNLLWWHAPNRRLRDIPGGADAFWRRVELSGAAGVLFMHHPEFETHTADDAREAVRRGLDVAVRAAGEGAGPEMKVAHTRAAIREFDGLCEVMIAGGNEPTPFELWPHAYLTDEIADECLRPATEAGMLLATPGWTGQAEPPPRPAEPDKPWQSYADDDPMKLPARIHQVYSRFDAITVHAYGEHVLDGHVARLARWALAFGKPLVVGEFGIAARDLLAVPPHPARYRYSERIKAARYGEFLRDLATPLPGGVRLPIMLASPFIDSGATQEWLSFTEAGVYDPEGVRGYGLSDEALLVLNLTLKGQVAA
jgi:hypothetical protein